MLSKKRTMKTETGADELVRASDGIRYSRFGTRPSGLASFLDQELYKQNEKNMALRLGSGAVQFQALDAGGNPMKNCHANFGGNEYYSATGKFKINDEFKIKKIVEMEEEHEKAVDACMRYILTSDRICRDVVSTDQWTKISGRLKPSDLKKHNPKGDTFWGMYRELRDIISEDLPIFDTFTSEKQLNEDAQAPPAPA